MLVTALDGSASSPLIVDTCSSMVDALTILRRRHPGAVDHPTIELVPTACDRGPIVADRPESAGPRAGRKGNRSASCGYESADPARWATTANCR